MKKVEAVIFDMDGIIIDSEPFWRRSMIKAFGEVGVYMDEALCIEHQGTRIEEIVAIKHGEHPWEGKSQTQLAHDIVTGVVELVKTEGKPMEGLKEVLNFFTEKEYPLAIASSSAMRLIEAVVQTFKLSDHFVCLNSAEGLDLGKPHPEVYLQTAHKLGVDPKHCLAIEDSFNGLLSAKAASMLTIAIPEEATKDNPGFCIADVQLDSLLEIQKNWDIFT